MNVNIDQMIRVAIYLRLSKDDGDFSLSENGKTESNSIHNQRELLMSFLQGHPEMELVGEYKDDGYTGTNFDRPDFQKMIQDIQKGLINCVIVKDLSRFGRDYIECGRYIIQAAVCKVMIKFTGSVFNDDTISLVFDYECDISRFDGIAVFINDIGNYLNRIQLVIKYI